MSVKGLCCGGMRDTHIVEGSRAHQLHLYPPLKLNNKTVVIIETKNS